jgi:hypothetical protein
MAHVRSMASPLLNLDVKPHRGYVLVSPDLYRSMTYRRRQPCDFSRSADQGLYKMKIFARTVTCSWTSAMVTRDAHSASMTHAKQRSTGVYAFGGSVLHASGRASILPSSGELKPLMTRHWPAVAGSNNRRNRRTGGSLPPSNPLTCRTLETIGRSNKTSLAHNIIPLAPFSTHSVSFCPHDQRKNCRL